MERYNQLYCLYMNMYGMATASKETFSLMLATSTGSSPQSLTKKKNVKPNRINHDIPTKCSSASGHMTWITSKRKNTSPRLNENLQERGTFIMIHS
jgi:hypothetical protein